MQRYKLTLEFTEGDDRYERGTAATNISSILAMHQWIESDLANPAEIYSVLNSFLENTDGWLPHLRKIELEHLLEMLNDVVQETSDAIENAVLLIR